MAYTVVEIMFSLYRIVSVAEAWCLVVVTARRYASAIYAMALCLCMSVKSRCSTKTAKSMIKQTTPRQGL